MQIYTVLWGGDDDHPQTPVAEGEPLTLKMSMGEPREGSPMGDRGARVISLTTLGERMLMLQCETIYQPKVKA